MFLWEQAAIKRFLEARQQALSLFASKGYNRVGMRELASALGINCGSIYNHIESKEALLYEFCEELFELLHFKAVRIQQRVAAPGRLRAIIEMHLNLQASMPCHFQLVERELRHLNEPWLGHANAQRGRYEQIVAASLGHSVSSLACAKSIVTMLNQAPAWLPGFAPTTAARLDLIHSMVGLMLAQAHGEPVGRRAG